MVNGAVTDGSGLYSFKRRDINFGRQIAWFIKTTRYTLQLMRTPNDEYETGDIDDTSIKFSEAKSTNTSIEQNISNWISIDNFKWFLIFSLTTNELNVTFLLLFSTSPFQHAVHIIFYSRIVEYPTVSRCVSLCLCECFCLVQTSCLSYAPKTTENEREQMANIFDENKKRKRKLRKAAEKAIWPFYKWNNWLIGFPSHREVFSQA